MPSARLPAIVVGGVLLCWTFSTIRAAEPSSVAAPGEATSFIRPELVAIAWASPRVQSTPDGPIDPSFKAWGPDGAEIPAAKLLELKKELREFGATGRAELDRLPALHLVFRIDSRALSSQRLTPSVVNGSGRIESLAVQEGSSAGRLALSVLSLPKRSFDKWPGEIDVEIRCPIDEGDVFQTIREVTDEPAEVAPGLRLFWTKVPGPDQKFVPAVALEIDRARSKLVDYDFFTHLKDGTSESLNSVQVSPTHERRVSPALESRETLDRIDLWRVRYRMERYDRLPIFPDHIPR
jgi:hypothetical protein